MKAIEEISLRAKSKDMRLPQVYFYLQTLILKTIVEKVISKLLRRFSCQIEGFFSIPLIKFRFSSVLREQTQTARR